MSAASASLTAQDILESIKSLSTADLLKVATAATTLAAKNVKKASKSASVPRKKGKKTASTKSDVSQSSSDASPVTSKRGAQLVKPRAWVTYVLEDARANGWPTFTITQSKKDKMTGVRTESPLEVPASHAKDQDGKYTFEDGKDFIHKYAMSLSKVYWSVKSQTGSRPDLYTAFEEQYVPPTAVEAVMDVDTESDAN